MRKFIGWTIIGLAVVMALLLLNFWDVVKAAYHSFGSTPEAKANKAALQASAKTINDKYGNKAVTPAPAKPATP